jgi:carboxyl-terminal processing protease
LGTTSFGKGTVQEIETFYDNSSIRLTVAKWFTPNDRDINKHGVTPDIIVEITEEDILNEYDSQKEKAAEYLGN